MDFQQIAANSDGYGVSETTETTKTSRFWKFPIPNLNELIHFRYWNQNRAVNKKGLVTQRSAEQAEISAGRWHWAEHRGRRPSRGEPQDPATAHAAMWAISTLSYLFLCELHGDADVVKP